MHRLPSAVDWHQQSRVTKDDSKKICGTMLGVTVLPTLPAPAAYRALRDEFRRGGLLDSDPVWYAGRMAVNGLLLLASVLLLVAFPGVAALCLSALLLAFAFVQTGFVAHDAQHGQILRSRAARSCLSLVHWNLLTGISHDWWKHRHGRHHLQPNVEGMDPDLYPILTYSRGQALRRQGLARFIARHQLLCYLPLLACTAVYFRCLSLAWLVRRRPRGWLPELGLLGLHHAVYAGLLLHFLTPGAALGFVLLNQVATGWYMGAVFSSNHSAMPLVPAGRQLLDQLHSTRNVVTGRVGDFLFGGLNYQIEHHLFPSMPRSRLRQASIRVQAFCDQHALPYHRCSLRSTWRDIAADLHDIGAPLRAGVDPFC
jgi:fatty acid desaturase